MSDLKKLLLLILVATLVRLWLASSVELGDAEAYYWVFAQNLQLNYFDHPPVVAWLIRLTTANLLLHGEIFVRLGAVLSSAVCTCLIYKIATLMKDRQAGWFAALLYTSSLYASMIAGAFVLPDGPQMIFWLLSILLLVKILVATSTQTKTTAQWIWFGVASGLCIMCKVHGIFLWVGVVLYALLWQRSLFRDKGFYLALAIAFFICSPILVWNIQNDFATYKFHSERVSLSGVGPHFLSFGKELLSVILICNPINFFLIYRSLLSAIQGRISIDKRFLYLLLCCGLPLVFTLLIISLFRETMAHWSGPAYSCLLILPAVQFASGKSVKKVIPLLLKWALAFTLLIFLSQILVINYYPGTVSKEKEGLTTGKGDATLDEYGWKELSTQFDSVYKADVTQGKMPTGAPIVITSWFLAAHIDFYIASKTKQQTIGLGNVTSLHQYYWTNRFKKPLQLNDSAYFIFPSNLFDYKAFDSLSQRFERFDTPITLHQYRGGLLCREVFVFRMKGFRG